MSSIKIKCLITFTPASERKYGINILYWKLELPLITICCNKIKRVHLKHSRNEIEYYCRINCNSSNWYYALWVNNFKGNSILLQDLLFWTTEAICFCLFRDMRYVCSNSKYSNIFIPLMT